MKGWPTMKSTVANDSTNCFEGPHQPERLIVNWDTMVTLTLEKYNWIRFATWRAQALISNFHSIEKKFSQSATTHTFFILKCNSGSGPKLCSSIFIVNKDVTFESLTSFDPTNRKQLLWQTFIYNFLFEFFKCF